MITFGKTSSKPNHLFGKLPPYYKENDSYKDINGEGLLERYLQIFCAELDDNLTPYVDDLSNIINTDNISSITRENPLELLQYISEFWGNPPDIGTGETYSGNEDNYIELLKNMPHLNSYKGTTQGIEYYLNLYSYTIDTITETSVSFVRYDETPTPLQYDNGVEYDTKFIFFSDFELVITDKSGTGPKNPPQSWLDDYLKPAIQNFISPIWAILNSVTYV